MPHWLLVDMDSWLQIEAVAALLGTYELPEFVPSPQWPCPLLPQQLGAMGSGGAGGDVAPRPASTGAGPGMPHVATLPTASAVQVAVVESCVGTLRSVAVPSPSWPPLAPQHNGAPAEVTAHESDVAAEIWPHALALLIAVGTGLLMSVPSPIWPLLL